MRENKKKRKQLENIFQKIFKKYGSNEKKRTRIPGGTGLTVPVHTVQKRAHTQRMTRYQAGGHRPRTAPRGWQKYTRVNLRRFVSDFVT